MTTIEILSDANGSHLLVGQAHITRSRGQVSTTFLYDPSYLADGGMNIDPALSLVPGAQYQSGLIGAFADSAPDRWGRNLIRKAERSRARDEGRVPRQLDDLDFLLGVSDDTRQGALRFRSPGSDEFLGEPSSVPRLVAVPELLHASDELASDDDPSDAVKPSVRVDDGGLAIAKFPHSSDSWDVMAWEATALDLLETAGVRTPQHQLTQVGNRSILILRRFDRTRDGGRIGYISAMTATGSSDGDQKDYADLAEAIRDLSRSPVQDLHEFYDRIIASIALGNTDDHLRNHGFLADRGLWRLSPVFDVNPNPDPGRPRATSIMGADAMPDEIDGLLAIANDYRITQSEARERIRRITASLSGWRGQARANRVPEREITMMSESIEPRLEALTRAAHAKD